jgi:hypothetical protein
MAEVPRHKDCRQANVDGTNPKNAGAASDDKDDRGRVTPPVNFVYWYSTVSKLGPQNPPPHEKRIRRMLSRNSPRDHVSTITFAKRPLFAGKLISWHWHMMPLNSKATLSPQHRSNRWWQRYPGHPAATKLFVISIRLNGNYIHRCQNLPHLLFNNGWDRYSKRHRIPLFNTPLSQTPQSKNQF